MVELAFRLLPIARSYPVSPNVARWWAHHQTQAHLPGQEGTAGPGDGDRAAVAGSADRPEPNATHLPGHAAD
jgi:hypothetical protein